MSTTSSPWDKFLEFEQTLGLEDWEYKGVKIWKLLRMTLWEQYRSLLEGRPPTPKKRRPKVKKIFFYGLNLLLANPFLVFKRKKRIVLAHDREVIVNGIPSDPTSSRALLGTPKSENLILFTSPGSCAHYQAGQKSNFLPNELGILISKFFGFSRSPVDMTFVGTIIENLFGLVADEPTKHLLKTRLARQVIEEQRRFRGASISYGLLFSLLRPKYLYLVVSYGREGAISAARAHGVETIEFQHGFAGRGHPGYDFEGWKEVPYFPDQFLSWGPGWLHNTSFPTQSTVHYVGSSFISNLAEKVRLSEASKNTLLVMSQGESSRHLIECAIDFARLRPNWRVTLKLHPKENLTDFEASEIGQDVTEAKITVVEGQLYDLFAKHDIVLGDNSTALVEAAYAGCKVAILRTKFRDFSEELCNNGVGTGVKSAKSLVETIYQITPGANIDTYFSTPIYDISYLTEVQLD